jgi:ATP-dependent RNA helicase DeaD
MTKFKVLKLSEGMANTIREAGFTEPSEIQQKTIPLVLAGKDVIGGSATGSGKTLAFGAGMIDKVKRGNGIQALILTPTRELAEQVAHTLKKFSKHTGINVREIYGGVSMGPQVYGLREADIVVGTPGRILDHLERRTLDLSRIKFLVLDEADRMLDMGFIRDVERIIRQCPGERQTLLFSATISEEIGRIANKYMKNPVQVELENHVDPLKLHQAYYDVATENKFSLLVHLLKEEKNRVVMVFCNTRRNVDRLTRSLYQNGIEAMPIHGGLSQNRRSDTLRAFHRKETLILVCTDVAARGLDIKDVSHIYNFDIPTTSTEYTHRIGRTARAGKDGIAISFVSEGDHFEFRHIFAQNPNLERLEIPQYDMVASSSNFSSNLDRKRSRESHGHRGGGRGGFRGRGGFGDRGHRGGGDDRGRGRFGSGRRREGSRSSGRDRGGWGRGRR